MKNTLKSFHDILIPRVCASCGDVVLTDVPFCKNCIGDYARISVCDCPGCGMPRSECKCRKPGGFLFYYNDPVAKSVISYIKHTADENTVRFFADAVFFALDGYKPDCVVYPPRSRKNIVKYGFDHAELIAKCISARFGVPVVPAIKRVKRSAEQKLLSASQRRKNVIGAFTADGGMLSGYKNVLLIDDVFTTGATIGACANALKEAGVKKCKTFTLSLNVIPKDRGGITKKKKKHFRFVNQR